MNVFDTLAAHMQSFKTPLFAVTLTALPIPDTPVLLMLHWHGFFRRSTSLQGDAREPPQALPGSVIQMNQTWKSTVALDEAMLDAAWRLGAWQLEREEMRACSTAGASDLELQRCRQAFATDIHDGQTLHLIDAPDLGEMLALGARKGYVRWLFRPVKGGIWQHAGDDDSLDDCGGREPPCPHGAKQLRGAAVGLTRYRLGHQSHLYLPYLP